MPETNKFQSQFTGEEVEAAITNGLVVPERTIINPEGARTTTIAVGGLAKGTSIEQNTTVAELLKKMVFAYQAFSVTCSSDPSSSAVYEKGTSVKVNSISYRITTGSDPITSVELLKGSTSVATKTSGIGTSGSFTVTNDSVTAAAPITYTIKATDGTNTKSATVTPCTFVDPFFYGVLNSSGTPSATLSSLGTKDIAKSGNKTYTFTANGQYPFIAYPASYGSLVSIKDASGFEYLANFNVYTLSASVTSGTVSYKVYVQKTAANVTDFKYTFEF